MFIQMMYCPYCVTLETKDDTLPHLALQLQFLRHWVFVIQIVAGNVHGYSIEIE